MKIVAESEFVMASYVEYYTNVTSEELWRRVTDAYCDLLPDVDTYDVMNELVAQGFEPCEEESLKKTVIR
jgi:hypothetical protein